jgi:hypothetical protein
VPAGVGVVACAPHTKPAAHGAQAPAAAAAGAHVPGAHGAGAAAAPPQAKPAGHGAHAAAPPGA